MNKGSSSKHQLLEHNLSSGTTTAVVSHPRQSYLSMQSTQGGLRLWISVHDMDGLVGVIAHEKLVCGVGLTQQDFIP